jgi:chromate transporter
MRDTPNETPTSAGSVTLGLIFRTFLLIGTTSFGGAVVAYLRSNLVDKHRWIDDPTLVELLAISQSLPGLNSVNVAILVGDRLRGIAGAIAAIVGLCLPGALVMFAVGVAYGMHGSRPAVTAMLHGVAAAAVGLVTSVTLQLGRSSLTHLSDLGFVALTIIGVTLLHLRVPYVLLGVGVLAIWWYRPHTAAKEVPER